MKLERLRVYLEYIERMCLEHIVSLLTHGEGI